MDIQEGKLISSIHKFIEPVLQETYGQPASDRHLVVVAHGIFNFEIREYSALASSDNRLGT